MLSKQGGRKSGVAGTSTCPPRAGGALRVTEHLGVGRGAVYRKPFLVAVLVMQGEAEARCPLLIISPLRSQRTKTPQINHEVRHRVRPGVLWAGVEETRPRTRGAARPGASPFPSGPKEEGEVGLPGEQRSRVWEGHLVYFSPFRKVRP